LFGVEIAASLDEDEISVQWDFQMAQRVRQKKWIDEKKVDNFTRMSFIIFVFVYVR